MTHRNINNSLTVFVVVVALFILLAPLIPQLDYIMNGPGSVKTPAFVSGAKTTQGATINTGASALSGSDTSVASQNQLYIPSIGALAPIIEGTNLKTVDKGLWHRPASSTPDKGGNTVIVGHRFSFNPHTVQPFYHLDKIKIGDKIYVYWNGKTYTYTVATKRVVKPTEVSVEAPTKQAQLTIYTCTPLWNPVDRLVVTAQLDGAK